jgi:hypothetical protein
MSDLVLKDVWKKDDAKVEQDAIAAWRAADAMPKGIDPHTRAKELAVAAYDDDALAAVTTCRISYLDEVRQTMAMFRLFVVPGSRRRGIAGPITQRVFEVMQDYSLANPQLRIGGLGAFLVAPGHLKKGYTPHERLMLIGYSRKNHPIIAKWFDHFEIDEAEAQKRVPGRG